MKRVASLYLPHWAIDRIRRAERRRTASQPDNTPPDLLALKAAADAEQGGKQCDAPRDTGWRPGARWARDVPSDKARPEDVTLPHARVEVERRVAALPEHQRPPMREMGRRSEAADHPFRLPSRSVAPDPRGQGSPAGENRGVTTPRWTGFDGIDPSSDDRAAARLAQWNAIAAVRSQGEGTRPSSSADMRRPHSNDPHAQLRPVATFFDTGRSTATTLARTCRDAVREPIRAAPADDSLLVTVHTRGSRVEIAAASPGASRMGVQPGMALTQARAAVPDLVVRDADPEGERADLGRLAMALIRRWTPVVAISDADGLFLDLTGVAHLHGGEAAMARRIVALLARIGITARIAIADTAGTAWAVSRFGMSGSVGFRLIKTNNQSHAIAALPIAALRLDDASVEMMRRLGIDTVGQLAAFPRAPLVRRFGRSVATRLDQASGALPEPLTPIAAPLRIAVSRRFAEPIATAEGIAYWLSGLVEELAAELAKAGKGARALLLVADRVDNQAQIIRVGLARATRDAPHMLRLIARRIEEIDPGYGIDALTLHVRRADPLAPEMLAAHLSEDQASDLAPLVDMLANRIGAARLWRHRAIESDVPERSVGSLAPLADCAEVVSRIRADDVRQLDTRLPDHPWHPRWPRPARLLLRPERLDHVMAEMPDFPPVRFTWRGREHRVVRGDGPERITGEWWRRTQERHGIRDYFQVEDEHGQRFWLFRRGDGQQAQTGDLSWYMHGTFA